MDPEKVFYGIDKVRKRKSRRRFIWLAVVFLLLGLGLVKYGILPQKWFLGREDVSQNLIIRNTESSWITTKKGYLFFVRGEVMNESDVPVSYIKLRSRFRVSDSTMYTQDFYAGNTLSMREIRNADATGPFEKLGRKEGDNILGFDESRTTTNFNIKPGNTVFFNTFYLSVKKILGLKYEIQITDFEVMSDE